MFGNSNNTGTSSFSIFGRNDATSTANAFTFGSPKPTTGFGAFGGGGDVAGDGVPAAGTSGTSIFGVTAPDTFGGGSSLFGQPKPITTFGFAATPATDADADPPPVTTGTSTPAYSVFSEKDPSNPSIILQHQSITATPAYKGNSFEDLRVQDYQRSGKNSAFRPVRQRPGVLDPSKQERLETLLRQYLLEEVADIRFYIFSARSSSSGRIMKPRVLRTNKAFLSKSSKYLSDLLNADTNPSDSSWTVLTDADDIPSNTQIDDYGYESDSDLDDCDDSVANLYARKDQSATLSISPSNISAKNQSKDNDRLSESVGSDMFMSAEQQKEDEPFFANKDARSEASSETAVQDAASNKTSMNQTAMHLRSSGSRHVLIKDAAFQTWYTLLNYLYTDNVNFLPLSPATPGGRHESSTSSLDEPRCSAKSMYRLASKAGLDDLRDEALTHIRSQLTEHNILKELSCSLVPRHPELLEMELDVLHSLATSPSVVANFPALAQRIANKELAHGADIIVGMHTRFLKQLHPFLDLTPAAPLPQASFSRSPKLVKVDCGNQEESLFGTRGSDSTPSVSPDADMAVPAATSSRGPKKRGGKKARGRQASQATLRESVPVCSITPAASDKPKDDEESAPQNACSPQTPKPEATEPAPGKINFDRWL